MIYGADVSKKQVFRFLKLGLCAVMLDQYTISRF